jgi:Family of unknown function (DUF6134)
MKSAWWMLLLATWLVIGSVQAADGTRSWNFEVFLDDKLIGYHHFTLRERGDGRELQSSARFEVKLLLFTAYRYVHDDTETWSGDCLQSLTSRTDDNGKQFSVNARQQGAAMKVVTASKTSALNGCVMSFAYWNPLMLQQTQLLNAQTGEYDRVTITALGDESRSIRGSTQLTHHYRVAGNKLKIDLWYSSSGDWLGLESTADNGRRLRYIVN